MNINLIGPNSKFCCAELGGGVIGDGSFVCNRDVPLSWEKIREEPFDDGVSLRVKNNNYITAEPDGSISTDRIVRASWEKWFRVGNGYKSYHGKYMILHDNWLVRADAISPTPETFFSRIELNQDSGEHGQLHIVNRDFRDETEDYWQARIYTVHYLINSMFSNWNGPDFDSILDEPIELGFNVILSLGMHASPWKTANGWRCTPIEHPDYYVKLAEMFDRASARKVRIMHGPLVDMQHLPSSFNKQAYFQQSCGVMAGRWNVMARKGNEQNHNGWHQNDYQYPGMGGVLTSQGSIGEDKPPRLPYLHWTELETRRNLPKGIYDSTLRQIMDGDFNYENGKRAIPTNGPAISIEPIYFNETNPDYIGDHRSTDPRVALETGLLNGLCAGGAFGASASLEGKPLGPIARECAVQFIKGIKASFIRPLAGLDFQGQH